MSERGLRRIAWLLLGLALLCYGTSLILTALIPLSNLGQHSRLWPVDPTNLSLAVYAISGAWIALRRPRNAIGWTFLGMGFTWEVFALTNAYILFAKLVAPGLPFSNAVLLLPAVMWVPAFGISPLLLLLFPGGRLPSPRWRPVLWLLFAGNVIALISSGSLAEAGSFAYDVPALVVQLGAGFLIDPLQNVLAFIILLVFIAGVAALFLRFRRAKGAEREQLKWFCFAGVIFAFTVVGETGFFDQLQRVDPTARVPADLFLGIPAAVSFILIPLAAAVAILRYHLYEIDVIIRRTLIYGALTAILALVYSGSVVLLEQGFHMLNGNAQSPVIIVLSTLAISALFAPLRARLQGWIERRFYRRKYNSERVLARFSAAARQEVDITYLTSDLLEVVNESMQPERVFLWMKSNK